MKFYIEDIFNIDFFFYFLMLICLIIFSIWLFIRIIVVLNLYKSLVIFIALMLILVWAYYSWENFMQESAFYTHFNAEYVLEICSLIAMIDGFAWIVIKFIEKYAVINLQKKSEQNNLKKLKKEIEDLVQEKNFKDNSEMKKLYETLQISALSINKQKKIIQRNFISNMLISVIFFVMGLTIPELILFIIKVIGK